MSPICQLICVNGSAHIKHTARVKTWIFLIRFSFKSFSSDYETTS